MLWSTTGEVPLARASRTANLLNEAAPRPHGESVHSCGQQQAMSHGGINQRSLPVNRSLTLSPQNGGQRALSAAEIRVCAPTSDLCEKARPGRDGPDTRKTLQKQAHQRAARIAVSQPQLTALPHPGWCGQRCGSGGETRTPDPAVNSRLLCRLSYSGMRRR